ncbi:YeeE/YedE family protein [Roseibacterium sp. SDUM158017]|uniref:YeeE/YedE family protein n=1 Tax=Roseicyclus salinarum TaxID=3036773 RepID=UPI0024158D0D|nr:YeeE/YedE family protein [Roseibacterium sp. SDUM158017]MDG4649373.1 YeeE/YedE family protein [Roseibacterium sp. SDUM158017]
METLLETFGDGAVLLMAGLLTGLVFGAAAQRSQFCLRASTVELARGQVGPRMSVWLIVFATALASTQGAILAGWLEVADARQLSGAGSMSGAIVGGLMFGVGMVLARGCASRLLVLSATGNLRALVSGLVLTLVAQSALSGVLAPMREGISQLWMISGPARDAMQVLGLSRETVLAVAAASLLAALVFARLRGVGVAASLAAVGVGLAVTMGWFLTYRIAQASFEIVPVSSVTFTGPATDTLMALVTQRSVPLSFGIGLVPGVFVGAGAAALAAREWSIQRFGPDTPMERHIAGAVLMGFGAMLAGGCAVGAAVSGGAVMSATAWVAGASIWAGGMAATMLLDRAAGASPAAA